MPDTDLEVGGGGGHPDPAVSPKKVFRPFGPQFGFKSKWGGGGGGAGRAPPLDLPLIREGYLIKT